jgi:hypothetical protein
VAAGVAEFERVVERWVDLAGKAAERGKLAATLESFDLFELAEPLAKSALVSSMLGALDADVEMREGVIVEITTFARQAPFALKSFTEAIADFQARQVVTPEVFEAMGAEAQRRAFTVAGASTRDVIVDIKSAFDESIAAGESLPNFRKGLREKMGASGWLTTGPSIQVPTVPGTPWHVETIYRNGVLGSYSRGRQQQMLQPEVVAARPYWQIRTVRDSRQRTTHGAVHGLVLAVSDPFWRSAGPPPWGFNCRCRFISRTAAEAEAIGITDGSTITGLPDPGWTPQPLAA